MNVFSFTGNLTKEPELKYSGEGKAYTKFTVAVQRRFNRDEADFFNCTAFGKQAETIAEYCNKGSKVGVVGQVNIDRKDDKYFTNILVDSVDFLTPKKEQSRNEQQSGNKDPFDGEGQPIDLDNLPF